MSGRVRPEARLVLVVAEALRGRAEESLLVRSSELVLQVQGKPVKDDWELVIAMDDGWLWTDPNAIRGRLGPFTKQEAEAALADFKRRHPEKSVGIRPRKEAR